MSAEKFIKVCFQVSLNAINDRSKEHSIYDKKFGKFTVRPLPDGRLDVNYSASDRGFAGYEEIDKAKTDAENAWDWVRCLINMICDRHGEAVRLREKMHKQLLEAPDDFCLEMTE